MYTGTMINDLMTMVERAEQRAQLKEQQRRETREEMEVRMLETMYSQPLHSQPMMAGAA
jgi:20S proteasome alpha/beta subunit